MRSLQSTLMLWIGGAIATILIAAGSTIYLIVGNSLHKQFDEALERSGRTLAAMVETDGKRIRSETHEFELPQFSRSNNPDYYQIFDAAGNLIESSPRMEGRALPLTTPRNQNADFAFATLPDGRVGRIATINFIPRFEGHSHRRHFDEENILKNTGHNIATITLVIGRDTIDLTQTLSRIKILIVIVTAVAILIGLVIAAWVARHGLRPLRIAVDDITRIDGKHLDIRLDPITAPTEIRPTIVALNQMLDRLNETFQRERNFSANVAHELRTPLAGIKSTIEVAMSRKRDSEQYDIAFSECLAICDETETVIDNLFMLSRVDAGKCSVQTESVDVSLLAREVWNSFEQQITARNLSACWQMDEAIKLQTDHDKLRLVFRNLIENAISYSPDRSAIEIVCEQLENAALFQITNQALNLTPSDMQHVFERFWRADQSRSQTGQHSGLGLSLCRSLIELLGGTAEAKLTNNDRFAVKITIPWSPEL